MLFEAGILYVNQVADYCRSPKIETSCTEIKTFLLNSSLLNVIVPFLNTLDSKAMMFHVQAFAIHTSVGLYLFELYSDATHARRISFSSAYSHTR